MALNATITSSNYDYTVTQTDPARVPRYRYVAGAWVLAGHVVTTTYRVRTLWTAATKAAIDAYISTYIPPSGAEASINPSVQNLIVGSWQLEIVVAVRTVAWEPAT
jgi:hypothetical protein